MKAVVMARGIGRRMRAGEDVGLTPLQAAAASAGLKAMMPVGPPVAGGQPRPFLDHVLQELADAGVDRVALVVAPDHEPVRRWYCEVARPTRLSVDFVVQPAARGTADAVLASEPWVGVDDFLVINGDNLYPAPVLRRLVALGEPGLAAFNRRALTEESNIPAERIGAFAAIDVAAGDRLAGIVEKPGAESLPGDALVSMNCWRFDSRIFAMCRDVEPSPRGELELTAAVARGLAHGLTFRVVRAAGGVLDLSSRADVTDVVRRLASKVVSL